MSIYRPLNYGNLHTFFNEITISLTKARLNCENFIIMRDFNIDISTVSAEAAKLEEFDHFD